MYACALYYMWVIPQQRTVNINKKKKTTVLSCNFSSVRSTKTQMFNKTLCEAMGFGGVQQIFTWVCSYL